MTPELLEMRENVAVLRQQVTTLDAWQAVAEHRLSKLERAHVDLVVNQKHIIEGITELKTTLASSVDTLNEGHATLNRRVVWFTGAVAGVLFALNIYMGVFA